MTRQLLAFGRKQMMQPEVIDTGEVIADTGTMLRRLIGENIDLAIVTGPVLSPVTPETLLRRVRHVLDQRGPQRLAPVHPGSTSPLTPYDQGRCRPLLAR